MDSKEKHEWARHYDGLSWSVATIMSTAIGGLLLYLSSVFNLILAFTVINLIILSVYFAASFRELRFIFQDIENDDIKIFVDHRSFLQWWPYLFIFMFLCLIWVGILFKNLPEGKIYWLIIALVNLIFIIAVGFRANGNNLKDRIKNIREKKKFNKLDRHFWLIIITVIMALEVLLVSLFFSRKDIKVKNSSWIHLSINLDNYEKTIMKLHNDAIQEKPTGIYKDLICYLEDVVNSSKELINRYFYLFEPNPHLFLALEVKDEKNIELIKNKIKDIKKPNFIASITIDINTKDESNGQAAVDFFYAGTKYAFFRVSDNYKPGYTNNNEVKLVHCFANQLFVTNINEIKFYVRCLQHRGVSIEKKTIESELINQSKK